MRLLTAVIITFYASCTYATSTLFKVIAPDASGNVYVDVNGVRTLLTAADPDVPLFTGSANMDEGQKYKYVVNDVAEEFVRSLEWGSSTYNDFFNRPITYATNIPELPTLLQEGAWTRGSTDDGLWDSNYIPSVFVTANPDDMEFLITKVSKKTYQAKITFIDRDTVSSIENCVFGLHKPGRKSNDAKQSWVWALPEGKFYAKRNWFKIRHMEEDPTQMREQLYSNIATKMGTYANQANLIRFFINNEFMGTFNILDDVVMYSYIVAMFYGGNVPSQLGGLFDGASGATFEYNSNPKKYDNFIPNIESPFKSDAISPFAKTFSEVDFENDEEVKAIAEYFDYDQFLRFMVMEFLTGHWDGYWMEQTNDGAYIDVMDNNKMYYLGQDFDATFGVNIGFGKSFIKVPYSEYPSRFPRAVLINKLLENNHTATLFRNYLEETVDTIFNKEVLGPYIEARHQFIYPDLEWDRSIEQQSPGHLAAWTAAQTKENLISPVTGPGKKHGGADWGLIEWIEAKEQLVREDLGMPLPQEEKKQIKKADPEEKSEVEANESEDIEAASVKPVVEAVSNLDAEPVVEMSAASESTETITYADSIENLAAKESISSGSSSVTPHIVTGVIALGSFLFYL